MKATVKADHPDPDSTLRESWSFEGRRSSSSSSADVDLSSLSRFCSLVGRVAVWLPRATSKRPARTALDNNLRRDAQHLDRMHLPGARVFPSAVVMPV